MSETLDLTFLGEQSKKTLTELQKLRRELADVRTLSLQTLEHGRRQERNLGEVKDDLELMLKAELMGRLSNFETRIEQLIDEKLDAMRGELPTMLADAVREGLKDRGK
jgi:hypothetical protein